MHRSTMKSTLGTALFIPFLLLTACGPEAGLGARRSPVNPETELVPPHAPIRKGYAWNATHGKMERVHYAEVDGLAVVEGDMIIGSVAEVEARTREVEARGLPEAGGVQAQGAAIVGSYFLVRWPNAEVPYTIDPTLPNPEYVTTAINAWQQTTRVRFVQRTSSNEEQYPNYVTFKPVASGCSASVGRNTGQRFVSLSGNCLPGNVMHEIGHVLGLWHEQSRPDRDSYVRILFENIMEGEASQFDKKTTGGDNVLAYDYGSIMHYPADAFSKNGQPTIVPILEGQFIGQRSFPSATDANTINHIYSIDDPEVFTRQTYLDVLSREPDSYALFNAREWFASCNGNVSCLSSTRISLARSLFESPEHRAQHPELDQNSPNYNAAYVTRVYTSFLRRQPDPEGYNWWLNALNSSGDYRGIISGFINSSDYRLRFGQQ